MVFVKKQSRKPSQKLNQPKIIVFHCEYILNVLYIHNKTIITIKF